MKGTQGSETSKYLKEEKSKEIPVVAASETGRGQTESGNGFGVYDRNSQLRA